MPQLVELVLLPGEHHNPTLLRQKAAAQAGLRSEQISHLEIIKSSLDARARQPLYRVRVEIYRQGELFTPEPAILQGFRPVEGRKTAIIVGAGPAGYFAALELLERGIRPIVLDRGKDVRDRRRDLRAIQQFGEVNPHSNYCFGEGGAGTYSDGKLYTRSVKRGDVRKALRLLVEHGAKSDILTEAHPHIGSNKLPGVVQNIRETILHYGGEVHFGQWVTGLIFGDAGAGGYSRRVIGVITEMPDARFEMPDARRQMPDGRRQMPDAGGQIPDSRFQMPEDRRHLASGIWNLESGISHLESGISHLASAEWLADAVILATGHSARDIYRLLHREGVRIEAKPFALGVRVEHPQELIDNIQYKRNLRDEHLPAASYNLVCQVRGRGVFSFCMCPGGLIVPSATAPGEIVVNGMSMSRRDSPFANSGLVTSVEAEDLAPWAKHGVFAAMEFQSEVERRLFQAGDGSQKGPSLRLPDFIHGKLSADLPGSSYIPGLYPSPLYDLLPPFIYKRLRDGLSEFGKMMRGFYTEEANVVATESRTSAPVRVPRDAKTLMHPDVEALFPCGEGAGYAGGIISAAMDGQNVARAAAELIGA